MNHPTNEVDDLVSMAEEAIADEEFSEAIGILRRAKSIAPLRKDIRGLLATALAGVPSRPTTENRKTVPDSAITQRNNEPHFAFQDEPLPSYLQEEYVEIPSGPEAVADVARKAFRAVADTTSRAGTASRQLSNLLSNGFQNWKSSMFSHESTAALSAAPLAAARLQTTDAVSEVTEAGIFAAPEELDQYLPPSSASISHFPAGSPTVSQFEAIEEPAHIEEPAPPAQPASKTRKRTNSSPGRKSNTGPTDVEDVIAAGIGGFIDAIGRADKKKIAYGAVYFAMGALFTMACIDVSKKFPAVSAVQSGKPVQAASMGGLDLTPAIREYPLEEARALAKAGKSAEAVEVLRTALATRLQPNAEQLKSELGAQLNLLAEEKLRSNQLPQSSDLYRQAVEVLPNDDSLRLRLANALYYQAIMDPTGGATQKDLLSEATELLEKLASKNSTNLQVYRVLALVHEADGNSVGAKASWQKVKTMASAGTAEHKEAVSHLK